MPQTLETPADFPGTQEIEKGDKKKFLVEVECTDKEDTGEMDWEVISIDGVKIPEDPDQVDEDTEDGIDENYDDSQDEGGSEDVTPSGKAKTTKGVGMLILSGKPK